MFTRLKNSLFVLALLSGGLFAPAWGYAQDSDVGNPFTVNELRFGGFNHDLPELGGREQGGLSIVGEALFTPFDFDRRNIFDNVVWEAITRPRLHVGASINTKGRTSFAYTGLTWRGEIGPFLFFEGTFGMAIHNGELGSTHRGRAIVPGKPGRAALGLRVLFRESISVGLQVTKKVSVVATLEHLSHGDVVTPTNNGLTNYGVKVGYKF